MPDLNSNERVRLTLRICNSLADEVEESALPWQCSELGLSEEDEAEVALLGKFKYIRHRVEDLSDYALIKLAFDVEGKHPDFAFREYIKKLNDPLTGPSLSDLTRRLILNELARVELFGDLGRLVIELETMWPLVEMDSGNLYERGSLRDSIFQHCIRNPEDWDNEQLLDHLDIIGCSRSLFFEFLERVVHPNSRRNQAQQNLIFAADGEKPEIVLSDAINNDILIVKNADKCLVYDRPISSNGLTKGEMLQWWQSGQSIPDEAIARKTLVERLLKSLGKWEGEKNLFRTYYKMFQDRGDDFPALIPQVYLHYDPYTIKQLGGISRLVRQRSL